jgi:hypothetical protein
MASRPQAMITLKTVMDFNLDCRILPVKTPAGCKFARTLPKTLRRCNGGQALFGRF